MTKEYKHRVTVQIEDDDDTPQFDAVRKWLIDNCANKWSAMYTENYGWWKHEHIARYTLAVGFKRKRDMLHFKLVWG